MIGRFLNWNTPDNCVRTLTGRPAVIRNHADLDRLIAERKALSSGRKGARTKRIMGLADKLEGAR